MNRNVFIPMLIASLIISQAYAINNPQLSGHSASQYSDSNGLMVDDITRSAEDESISCNIAEFALDDLFINISCSDTVGSSDLWQDCGTIHQTVNEIIIDDVSGMSHISFEHREESQSFMFEHDTVFPRSTSLLGRVISPQTTSLYLNILEGDVVIIADTISVMADGRFMFSTFALESPTAWYAITDLTGETVAQGDAINLYRINAVPDITTLELITLPTHGWTVHSQANINLATHLYGNNCNDDQFSEPWALVEEFALTEDCMWQDWSAKPDTYDLNNPTTGSDLQVNGVLNYVLSSMATKRTTAAGWNLQSLMNGGFGEHFNIIHVLDADGDITDSYHHSMLAIPDIPTDVVILEYNSNYLYVDENGAGINENAGSLVMNDGPWCIELGWAEEYIGPIRIWENNVLKVYSVAIGYISLGTDQGTDYFQAYTPFEGDRDSEDAKPNGRTFTSNGYEMEISIEWVFSSENDNAKMQLEFITPNGDGPYKMTTVISWGQENGHDTVKVTTLWNDKDADTYPGRPGYGIMIDTPVRDPLNDGSIEDEDYFEFNYVTDNEQSLIQIQNNNLYASPSEECMVSFTTEAGTSNSIERFLFADDSNNPTTFDFRNTIYVTLSSANWEQNIELFFVKQIERNQILGLTDGTHGELIANVDGDSLNRNFADLNTGGTDIMLLAHVEKEDNNEFMYSSDWGLQWRGIDSILKGRIKECEMGFDSIIDDPFETLSEM